METRKEVQKQAVAEVEEAPWRAEEEGVVGVGEGED